MRQSVAKSLWHAFSQRHRNPDRARWRRLKKLYAAAPKKRGYVARTYEEKDTQRQKKLIKLISENLGGGKKTKTMYEMMVEAGYEESIVLRQSSILTRIHDKVVPSCNGSKTNATAFSMR